MNKINFQNSQQPAINATNLNQMQNNIENAIGEVDSKFQTKYAIVTTTTASNVSSDFQVLLNNISDSEGNKFTISNNQIVIGAGVSKVRVSAGIFIEQQTDTGYIWGKIYKNSTFCNGAILPYTDVGNNLSISIPPMIVNVEQGDTFKLIVDSTAGGKIRTGTANTWILIEVVE